MKSLSSLLHKTPWWLLLGGGLLLLAGLALFVTPFQLIRLEKSGMTPEENRAIKREIDYAFSEGAIDVARRIVTELKSHTKDPARRKELERALEEIDSASETLREAGREVIRAKRDAAESVTEAVKGATAAITEAQKDAAQALRDAGVNNEKITKALEESARAAREAEAEARRAQAQSRLEQAEKRVEEARKRAEEKRRIVVGKNSDGKPMLQLDLDDVPAIPHAAGPHPPLPPEMRADIRRKVTGDLRRIGIGAGFILLFIPIFILTIVAKIFIDRSRAAQRIAEVKRKEAEYHRMSQQVTEAKLQALQAQVEPHFLYNTLASVQALTEVDPARANAMTGHLIQYLRNARPKMRESISTVGQEIELVRAYLNVLQMRMGERLSFEIEVPPEIANAPFPPLMLPSLVENAIKHGLEPLREGGKVTIRAEARDAILRLSVADTGRGFAESLGNGVGLSNIRERLAALYGDKGKLTLEANPPAGVVAAIEVPRDGARAPSASWPGKSGAPPTQPQGPRTAAARTFAAMGAAERMWRKGLSFAFLALVIVAAVICGLALVGVLTGLLPVQFGDETIGGTTGALIGTAGILVAFAAMVLAIAIVVAIFYGLGFLFVGLAIFIPLVIIVALVPALAPFIMVGLFVWWLIRRSERKAASKSAALESSNADSHPR